MSRSEVTRSANGTTFPLGGDASMVLNQLIDNPQTETGSSLFSVAKGTFVFVTGKGANLRRTNFKRADLSGARLDNARNLSASPLVDFELSKKAPPVRAGLLLVKFDAALISDSQAGPCSGKDQNLGPLVLIGFPLILECYKADIKNLTY